ncbi:alpha-tubulin suppressor protein Aats1 [Aspergillus sclerotialis]|uniref:Alpha-tubulin suppressor protein Aats1 n=1 Tax=Aspergillus sclerotialis TaxID=2070753 RepID=A0A3A2ZRP8_9EURO|nr:alpha-tubulin suppressor protein Aats1 [Aspergillus sclerotialis]
MPLFAFGSNGSGQLGIGHVEDVSVPKLCLFEDPTPSYTKESSGRKENNILRIAAGGNHTVVLFRDGSAYAAGLNSDARCGVYSSSREEESLVRFRRVEAVDSETGERFEKFKDVSATWEGTVLVSDLRDQDVVFVLGFGLKGELGLGEEKTKAETAVRIPDFPPPGARVLSIASGMGHSVAVLSNGEVFGWGGARKGQLGESVRGKKIAWIPVKIDGIPFRATDAACGREFTVIMGNKEAGEFVVLGSADNKWKVLSDLPSPSSVAGYKDIYASWHGVYVHQRDSSVISWGRNDRGQLPPSDLPKPRMLAIGSEHGLALLDDGIVVAFGWGEHGNCGPDTDAQGNVKGKLNKIPLEIEEGAGVVGVGAGCATSWIITS